MIGVGPAGSMLSIEKVRGRKTAKIKGGISRVGRKVVSKNEANLREPHRRSMMRRWYNVITPNNSSLELL